MFVVALTFVSGKTVAAGQSSSVYMPPCGRKSSCHWAEEFSQPDLINIYLNSGMVKV